MTKDEKTVQKPKRAAAKKKAPAKKKPAAKKTPAKKKRSSLPSKSTNARKRAAIKKAKAAGLKPAQQRAAADKIKAPVFVSIYPGGKDPETGLFIPGNQFWKAAPTTGRKPLYESPQELWNNCLEYFEYTSNTPLYEQKGFGYKGGVTKANFDKARPFTLIGLCIFLGHTQSTWSNYKTHADSDFLTVVTEVENIILQQKFNGTVAGFFQPQIMAYDLGYKMRETPDDQDKIDNQNPPVFEYVRLTAENARK